MTKQELALAEQNAKMREALTDALYWLPEKRHRGGVENGYWEPSGDALLRSRAVVVKALSLPDLATPPVSEYQKDAELLDYIQNHGATIQIVPMANRTFGFEVGGLHKSRKLSVREAIDAAMQEDKP